MGTTRGASGESSAGAPSRLLLGSIHCHSVFSDGSGTPRQMLATAGRVGLDFLAITDHVPSRIDDHAGDEDTPCPSDGFPAASGDFPRFASGVVRVPGLEYSPRQGHYLVLGADPWEVPGPSEIAGWPGPSSSIGAVAGRTGALGFVAHPDDEGNGFLNLPSYGWRDWGATGYCGLEVWNLATDLARILRGYRDVIRAALAGPYRAVPPPHPATVARWDSLAQRRRVVGLAGTDAHAYATRWHGIPLTVVPYTRAFESLQTGVWVDRATADGPPDVRVGGIIAALGRGRALMVNRAWGHPLGFVFQARRSASPGRPFVSGDVVPVDCPVRFEVSAPGSGWIRLIRNGVAVANTYGRELSLEPFPPAKGTTGPAAGRAAEAGASAAPEPAAVTGFGAEVGEVVQEAWRVEVWVSSTHWSKAGSGFFLWILSNHIYRAVK